MTFALIADIHGNALALEAVLSDVGRLDIDKVICLGDVCAFGAQPVEALELLKKHDVPTVMGNTDAWLLEPPTFSADEAAQRNNDQLVWCRSLLSKEHTSTVQSFSSVLEVQLTESQTLLCYHGSPSSFDDIILPSTPDEEVRGQLEKYPADVYVGGHTHVPMYRRIETKIVINTGSVGLPLISFPPGEQSRYLPYSEYVVLQIEENRITTKFRQVPLDIKRLRDIIANCGAPHSTYWLSGWVT